MADREGIITFIEGKGLDLLDLKSLPSAGDDLCDVFGHDSAICRNSREALKGREFTSIDHIDSLIFQVYYNCLMDQSNAITGVVGVALDVTAGLHAQAELEKFRNEVARTRQMALLGTLGRTMAEQLGEPLSVARPLVRKAIEDLSESSAASPTSKSLVTALEKVSSAKDIIDSFCEKANITAKPVAEPIDLMRMVRRITAVFGEPAKRASLKLTTAGMDVVPGMYMSARQLEQIFFILIQNAIDAADPEKEDQLHINCRQDHQNLVFTFTDTCGGMTEEELSCVFEPFFVTQSSGRDLGMGLAIAKELITACEGTIVAESTPGKGTIFTVTLPIEQVY
jgi:signal transduction histidine kinase